MAFIGKKGSSYFLFGIKFYIKSLAVPILKINSSEYTDAFLLLYSCINTRNENIFSVPDGGGICSGRSESFCEPAILYEDHAAVVALSCGAGGGERCMRDTGRAVVITCGNKGNRCMVYHCAADNGIPGEYTDGDQFCTEAQSLFMGGDIKAAIASGAGMVGMEVYAVVWISGKGILFFIKHTKPIFRLR